MKREVKRPGSRKQSASDRKASRGRRTTISGGANLKGQNIGIGGDVVERDKLVAGDDIIQAGQYIKRQTTINIPRGVQLAVGAAAAAVVVMAVWFVTRPPPPVVMNGGFESDNTDGWTVDGTIQVIPINDPKSSAVGQYAAQFQIGASLQQTVTVPAEKPVLTVWYRAPPGASVSGILSIYLNDQLVFRDPNSSDRIGKLAPADAPDWLVALVGEDAVSAFSGQTVMLRVVYAAFEVKFHSPALTC